MEHLIEYKDTNTFKITITSDKQMRIKIPTNFKNKFEEEEWINKCNFIFKQLKEIEIKLTLRFKTKDINIDYAEFEFDKETKIIVNLNKEEILYKTKELKWKEN